MNDSKPLKLPIWFRVVQRHRLIVIGDVDEVGAMGASTESTAVFWGV